MNFLTSLTGFMNSATPIIQAVGGITSAVSSSKAYGSQADIQNYNSAMYSQQARLIDQIQNQNAETLARSNRSKLSEIKAGIGARGLNLSGSPLLLMAESAAALKLDEQNQQFNASLEASRARSAAANYGVEAKNYKSAGKKALTNGLISTAYKIASQY